jgi:hypothetical protein
MTPIVNVDVKMPKAVLRVLSLHETFCVVSGITEVTHDQVVSFIKEKAGDNTAILFRSEYLVSSPTA